MGWSRRIGTRGDGAANERLKRNELFDQPVHRRKEFHPSGSIKTSATRWTLAGEIEVLPKLATHDSSYVWGVTDDGSLAVGTNSHFLAHDERAVLWDSSGVRDIAQELRDAGVDLQGVELSQADRVWPGDPIRIQGGGWLATLPAR